MASDRTKFNNMVDKILDYSMERVMEEQNISAMSMKELGRQMEDRARRYIEDTSIQELRDLGIDI